MYCFGELELQKLVMGDSPTNVGARSLLARAYSSHWNKSQQNTDLVEFGSAGSIRIDNDPFGHRSGPTWDLSPPIWTSLNLIGPNWKIAYKNITQFFAKQQLLPPRSPRWQCSSQWIMPIHGCGADKHTTLRKNWHVDVSGLSCN